MIISYKFKNFCSYRENVEFSMLAAPSKIKKRFENNFVSTVVGYDVNKTCVIVGENAGGKTNFVKSLAYLKNLLFSNDRIRASKSFINSNCLSEAKDFFLQDDRFKQMFEIEVLINDVIYSYHLEIDLLGIVSEKLYVRGKKSSLSKQILDFKREKIITQAKEDGSGMKWSIVADVSFIDEDKYDDSVLDRIKKEASSGLFINKLAILAVEEAFTFLNWMKNNLSPISYSINYDFIKSVNGEDEEDKLILKDSRFLEILRMIDYSIIDIEISDEDPYKKTNLIRKGKNGNTFKREIERDSSGIGEYFVWAIQIFKVVYRNQCVIADEVDRVLNPVLSDRIIAFINGKIHMGQFIFTTHNVLHLDLRNYMKEQIYFATKSIESLESELYSLADFSEVKYDVTHIYEFYMKGILGGVADE